METLIKGWTPFTGKLYNVKFFCKSKISPLLFLDVQYDKVEF